MNDSFLANLQGFRGGPHFPELFAAVKPYIGDITEMRHYAATGVANN